MTATRIEQLRRIELRALACVGAYTQLLESLGKQQLLESLEKPTPTRLRDAIIDLISCLRDLRAELGIPIDVGAPQAANAAADPKQMAIDDAVYCEQCDWHMSSCHCKPRSAT